MPWNRRRSLLIVLICFLQIVHIDLQRVFAQTASMLQPAVEQNYQSRPYQGFIENDDGQWTRPAKDYASTRFSSLNEINATNAKTLKLAFTFSTGMTRGHERYASDGRRHAVASSSRDKSLSLRPWARSPRLPQGQGKELGRQDRGKTLRFRRGSG